MNYEWGRCTSFEANDSFDLKFVELLPSLNVKMYLATSKICQPLNSAIVFDLPQGDLIVWPAYDHNYFIGNKTYCSSLQDINFASSNAFHEFEMFLNRIKPDLENEQEVKDLKSIIFLYWSLHVHDVRDTASMRDSISEINRNLENKKSFVREHKFHGRYPSLKDTLCIENYALQILDKHKNEHNRLIFIRSPLELVVIDHNPKINFSGNDPYRVHIYKY